MKRIAMPFLLALLSATMAAPGCAGIYDDCVKPEAGKITWTGTATELGEMVVIALQCDPSLDPAVAPVCAIEELNNLEATLGPDGKATINCIIAKIEGNPSAAAALKSRAHAVGVKRGVNQSMICPDGAETITSVYKKESPARRSPTGAAPGERSIVAASLDSIPHIATEQSNLLRGRRVSELNGIDLLTYSDLADERLVVAAKLFPGRPGAVGSGSFAYAGPNPGAALASCDRECGDNAHGAIAPPGGCECWRKVGSTWAWVAAR